MGEVPRLFFAILIMFLYNTSFFLTVDRRIRFVNSTHSLEHIATEKHNFIILRVHFTAASAHNIRIM
jgi:hypothetical protein